MNRISMSPFARTWPRFARQRLAIVRRGPENSLVVVDINVGFPIPPFVRIIGKAGLSVNSLRRKNRRSDEGKCDSGYTADSGGPKGDSLPAHWCAAKLSPFGPPESAVYPESHLPSSDRRFFLLKLLTESPAFPMMRTNGGIGKPTLISTTTRLFSGPRRTIASRCRAKRGHVRAKGDIEMRFIRTVQQIHNDERGHVEVGLPALVAAIAAIVLAIGAAADSDVVTIISGVVLGVALLAASLARHRQIDYDVWRRLDKLEK